MSIGILHPDLIVFYGLTLFEILCFLCFVKISTFSATSLAGAVYQTEIYYT